MKIVPVVLLILLILLALVAMYVWPTKFRYDTVHAGTLQVSIRTNRLTGISCSYHPAETDRFGSLWSAGWYPVQVPESTGNKDVDAKLNEEHKDSSGGTISWNESDKIHFIHAVLPGYCN